MRLRDVGPGIGGLYYGPLLQKRNERIMRRALARLPVDAARVSFRGVWQSIRSTAETMGRRIVAAREAQAQRLIASESARLFSAETQRNGRAIGARYY